APSWKPTTNVGPVSGTEILPEGTRILVVQFKQRVPARRGEWATDLHERAVAYLPDDALVIRASDAQAASLAARPEVHWMGPYQREWRVSSEVGRERARLGLTESAPLDLELGLWRGSRPD